MTVEWTPRIHEHDLTRTCRCSVCTWEGDIDDTLPIDNFSSRICSGEEVPVGECMRCGSLAYFKHRAEERDDHA